MPTLQTVPTEVFKVICSYLYTQEKVVSLTRLNHAISQLMNSSSSASASCYHRGYLVLKWDTFHRMLKYLSPSLSATSSASSLHHMRNMLAANISVVVIGFGFADDATVYEPLSSLFPAMESLAILETDQDSILLGMVDQRPHKSSQSSGDASNMNYGNCANVSISSWPYVHYLCITCSNGTHLLGLNISFSASLTHLTITSMHSTFEPHDDEPHLSHSDMIHIHSLPLLVYLDLVYASSGLDHYYIDDLLKVCKENLLSFMQRARVWRLPYATKAHHTEWIQSLTQQQQQQQQHQICPSASSVSECKSRGLLNFQPSCVMDQTALQCISTLSSLHTLNFTHSEQDQDGSGVFCKALAHIYAVDHVSMSPKPFASLHHLFLEGIELYDYENSAEAAAGRDAFFRYVCPQLSTLTMQVDHNAVEPLWQYLILYGESLTSLSICKRCGWWKGWDNNPNNPSPGKNFSGPRADQLAIGRARQTLSKLVILDLDMLSLSESELFDMLQCVPQLMKLRLGLLENRCVSVLDVIGQCCPLIQSLTLTNDTREYRVNMITLDTAKRAKRSESLPQSETTTTSSSSASSTMTAASSASSSVFSHLIDMKIASIQLNQSVMEELLTLIPDHVPLSYMTLPATITAGAAQLLDCLPHLKALAFVEKYTWPRNDKVSAASLYKESSYTCLNIKPAPALYRSAEQLHARVERDDEQRYSLADEIHSGRYPRLFIAREGYSGRERYFDALTTVSMTP